MSIPVIVAALVAVPAGWCVLVLADRIPDARSLLRPAPAVPWPRGPSRGDALVYPATVVLFVLAALRFEELAVLVPHLLVFAVLLALAVIDMDTLRLPDRLNLPAIACSLAAIVAISFVEGIPEGIVGALLGAGIYFGVLLVAHLIHPAGMGFGDVKLALLMGLYLGWPTPGGLSALVVVVWAMLIGFGLGSVIGILLWLFRRRSAPYPFGPFLALGAVAVMLLAPDLLPASTAADLLF